MGNVLTDTSSGSGFPAWVGAAWDKKAVLRYGENPHQPAALYVNGRGGLAAAEQLHGKEMSYNNYVDSDAARRTAYDFAEPAVAIIKHANPCGIAVGADIAEAHRRAHECDPVSAYGGVIATNRPVTVDLAKQVAEIFTEVLVAPAFEDGAVEILQAKKNIRLLVARRSPRPRQVEMRPISGGLLLQHTDRFQAPGDDPSAWTPRCRRACLAELLADLAFAWKACRAVKSNAILLAADGASVGVGMGQVNRVDSCRLAVSRAGERAVGSVAASDAFFPFPDGLEVLIEGGVKAVVQPAARSATTPPSKPPPRQASPCTSPAHGTSSTSAATAARGAGIAHAWRRCSAGGLGPTFPRHGQLAPLAPFVPGYRLPGRGWGGLLRRGRLLVRAYAPRRRAAPALGATLPLPPAASTPVRLHTCADVVRGDDCLRDPGWPARIGLPP